MNCNFGKLPCFKVKLNGQKKKIVYWNIELRN